MATPYIGEIRLVPFNFAPVSWAFCNGAVMAISQNSTLFELIGTTYGGDGQNTFALPNLQSRVPVHNGTDANGNTYVIGQLAGVEFVTLNDSQIPAHSHPPQCNASSSNTTTPSNAFWGSWSDTQYSDQAPAAAMNAGAVGLAGGSQPHDNMVPYQVINFIIALYGIFPSQN
jgi:microcystin-dependent protein